MRQTRIFVAGPDCTGDRTVNTRALLAISEELYSAGYLPWIDPCFLFHLLQPSQALDSFSYALAWLKTCDALLKIPGLSINADSNVLHMLDLGKPVFHSIEELKKKLPTKIMETPYDS